jgi:hypothetical protein
MGVRGVFSVTRMRPLHTFSSNAALPDLYGHLFKQRQPCILRLVSPIFLEIGFMVQILGLGCLLVIRV